MIRRGLGPRGVVLVLSLATVAVAARAHAQDGLSEELLGRSLEGEEASDDERRAWGLVLADKPIEAREAASRKVSVEPLAEEPAVLQRLHATIARGGCAV